MRSGNVSFNCYYNGKFENSSSYVGGDVKTIDGDPKLLFTHLLGAELGVSMYNQRVWYKLPYENFSELKIMCSGDRNFQRMCEAALWTRMVDIFMELDDVNDANASGNGSEGNDISVEAENRPISDRTCGGEADDICEEEARVEANLEGFVDEEEHCNSEDTPPNSDCEDGEQAESVRRYERYTKFSGVIRLEQIFDSIAEFKEAVVDYVLKTGWNVKYTRWGSEISEVKCTIDGDCPFRIYCSYEKPVRAFMVKFCNDKHSCNKDGCSKVVKDGVIAKLFLNDIRRDIDFKPQVMQQTLDDRYDLAVSYNQCRKAKVKALKMLQEEYDEQFSRLKDYEQTVLSTNPGSTVELGTITRNEGLVFFEQFYVCFKALRDTWSAYCRPIIGIDGCFLKNNVKGQLLAAVGRDANNQIYPVAWAVVQVENTESWLWFIRKLKADLDIRDGEGFTLISDRQKGLLIAVDQELPKVEHRMCARHIYGNLARAFPGRSVMKKLFWKIAKSFTISEYEAAITEMKEYDMSVYEQLMLKNPRNCSRAFFTSTSCCEDLSNNFSETYNNTINKAREMPLVEMLETVRRLAMVRIDIRKKKSRDHKGKHSLKVAETIAAEEKYRKNCRAVAGANGWFDVIEDGVGFSVHMTRRTCTCRKWDMTGIPCRHALRVILLMKWNVSNYVSDWYLTSTWQNIYSNSITPVTGMRFWGKSGEARIQPPLVPSSQGRKKKEKRIKGKNESPKKKKLKVKNVQESPKKKVKATKVGRIIHCGHCGLAGHNAYRCSNGGATVYRKPKKPKKTPLRQSSVECMTLSQGEGPSQQSQDPLSQP